MPYLYYDPLFLEHDTGRHPEQPERLKRIMARLQADGLLPRFERPAWKPATPARLARVHQEKYIAAIERYAAGGGGRIEADTVLSPRSFDAACLAAGAVCDAVERVVKAENDPDKRALCLVRPPGHHAKNAAAMGFCLFGNVAVGARAAVAEHKLQRVLVVDWDVHHGNGTQDAFWEDPQVGFLSIHRWPFYPGTGDKTETGGGPGLGTTLNLPVAFGTDRKDYLSLLENELTKFAARLKPQLVILSAGFDAHRLDPVGSLGLETEDFAPLTNMVLGVAKAHAGGRLVSVLEGGYNVDVLGECVALHARELV